MSRKYTGHKDLKDNLEKRGEILKARVFLETIGRIEDLLK